MMGKISKAQFALILKGDNVPMELASELLQLTPTRVIRKGDLLNRLPQIVASQDEWQYTIQLSHPIGRDLEMDAFLRSLLEREKEIRQLQQQCEVVLRMYVQSDFAQMNYQLTRETLQVLCQTGLSLEISSLSWGEVGV